MELQTEIIQNYLNAKGQITSFPSKKHRTIRPYLYNYLITKFDADKIYNEKEVNEIIQNWFLIDDYVLIRRELIEVFLLKRTKDGRQYWVNKEIVK